jgi:general stress protein CsbA
MNSVLVKIPNKFSILISFPLLMGIILWFSILVENIFIAFFAIFIIPISIKLAYFFSFKKVKVDFFAEEIHFLFLNKLNNRKQEFIIRKDEIHSFSFYAIKHSNYFWLKTHLAKKIKINTMDIFLSKPEDYSLFENYFNHFIEQNKIVNLRRESNPNLYVAFILSFLIIGTIFLIYRLIQFQN